MIYDALFRLKNYIVFLYMYYTNYEEIIVINYIRDLLDFDTYKIERQRIIFFNENYKLNKYKDNYKKI